MSLSTDEKIIKLKSNDGLIFPIKIKVAKMSAVIARLIEDLVLEEETANVEIPLQKLASSELQKIIQFLENHINDTSSLDVYRENLKQNKLSDIDNSFIKTDKANLILMFNTANFLEIAILQELLAYAIARTIKGKTSSEINDYWHTECDFSEEELRDVQKGYAWISQK